MSYVAMPDAAAPAPTIEIMRRFAAAIAALLIAYSLLVWPLLYAVPVHTELTGYAAADASDNSALLTRIYVPALFVLAFTLHVGVWPATSRHERAAVWPFAVFLALAFASALWSLDPAFTVKKAVYQALLLATVALSAFASGDRRQMLGWIYAMFVIAVALNLAAVAMNAPGPIGHEGIYTHKNALGHYAAFAFILSLHYLFAGRGAVRLVAAVMIAASVVLMIAAQSKTAIAFAAVAPAAGLMLYAAARVFAAQPLATIVVLSAIAAASFVIAGQIFGFDLSDLLILTYGDDTFTGRTDIWNFAFNHIAERPVLGHGYQAFWGIGPESPKFRAEMAFIARMPHAHNGYIDILLTLGAAGLAVYLYVHARVLNRARAAILGGQASFAILYLSLFVFLAGSNFLESSTLVAEDVSAIIFLLLPFLAAMREGRVAGEIVELRRVGAAGLRATQ